MIPRQWLIFGCVAVGALLAAGVAYAKEEAPKAPAPEAPKVVLPEPVAKAVAEALPKAVVTKAESFERGGLQLYEVVLTEGTTELWAYVDAAGTIDKIKSLVDAKSLPPVASRAVDLHRAGAEIRKIQKIDYRSDIRRDGDKETLVKLHKPRVEYQVTVVRGNKEGHFTVAEATGLLVRPLKWKDVKEPSTGRMFRPEK